MPAHHAQRSRACATRANGRLAARRSCAPRRYRAAHPLPAVLHASCAVRAVRAARRYYQELIHEKDEEHKKQLVAQARQVKQVQKERDEAQKALEDERKALQEATEEVHKARAHGASKSRTRRTPHTPHTPPRHRKAWHPRMRGIQRSRHE